MKFALPVVLLMLFSLSYAADNAVDPVPASSPVEKKADKEKRWWEKRKEQLEIYYPHDAHMEVMKKQGDPCLLCHPFTKNKLSDVKQLKRLNAIANEPMKAICHDCHVDKLTATSRCNLCHYDMTAIWPDDHNFNYIHRHAEDARLDDGKCRSCHIDLSFCSDCHFRRDGAQRRNHALGYRGTHGIEARINAAQCGRCHTASFCTDCHREIP